MLGKTTNDNAIRCSTVANTKCNALQTKGFINNGKNRSDELLAGKVDDGDLWITQVSYTSLVDVSSVFDTIIRRSCVCVWSVAAAAECDERTAER